jgi:hypothetical protein
LSRFWRTWAFPIMAALGASMLLVHDHSVGSGANSPEAQAYLVDPDLDVNGNPRDLRIVASPLTITEDGPKSAQNCCMPATDASSMRIGSMPMDHSQMEMDAPPASIIHESHHHLMTDSMLHVERQHLWFMIVGLAIGLFKFISDSEIFRSRVIPRVWPSCMVILGLMLVFYSE